MPSRMYTIETRIPNESPLADYLDEYVTDYSAMMRRMWQDMTSTDFNDRYPSIGMYDKHIRHQYGLLKRTVNSIRFDIQGRKKSLMALKETELRQIELKISEKEEKIADIKKRLKKMKPKAIANRLSDKELEEYRHLKESLYWQKNKLNKYKQRRDNLEYQIRNKIYNMCFGSKAMFKKQHRLIENGYKTHEKWYNDFVKARDKNIFYLGSRDESFGNQLCRLSYDSGSKKFNLAVRKEYKYCASDKECDSYVSISGLDFKYMKDELIAILQSFNTKEKGDYPLTYRFHRVGNKWYLQVIFEQSFENYRTVSKYGTIGLDYNEGFIELSETNESGNLIFQKHYDLRHHGTGNRAEAEIRDVISEIIKYAENRCKDVVIEDLNFKWLKAKQTSSRKSKGKRYNRMLHLFDYHRYMKTMASTGFNHRVKVVMVNPRNTSKIGKQKYCNRKKLNVHQAASYVIARRGQGYVDKLKKK